VVVLVALLVPRLALEHDHEAVEGGGHLEGPQGLQIRGHRHDHVPVVAARRETEGEIEEEG